MPASLRLVLTDAAGQDLNDHLVVDLFSLNSSQQYQAINPIVRELVINGIDVSAGPFYRVMVSPANHAVMQFFVSLADGSTTNFAAPVPVDAAKVVSVSAPPFAALSARAQQVLNLAESPRFNDGAGGFLQGPKLYDALNPYPLLKACFLNIVAKAGATGLPDGGNCLDHFQGIVRMEQDRFFVRTTAALLEETAHSNAFHSVSAALHDPMPGYNIVSSFKTFDHYGNLQLTFQRRGDTGDDYAADVDIDDAQGFEHIFQVLRNTVEGPTNPYNIHDILLQQTPRVDPGYGFVFAAAAAA
jgi:hypothetical protein